MDSYGVPEWLWGGSPNGPNPTEEEQQYKHSFSDLDHPFAIGFNDDITLSGFLDSALPVAPRDCLKADSSGSSDRQGSSRTKNCALAQGDLQTEVTKRPRKRKNRTAETHNLTEKRRRDKIKAKMELREIIPNSQKLDKASLLDKAMSHIKILQWQRQIMGGMSPYSYFFAPQTPHCSGTTQRSQCGPPTPPNAVVVTGLNTPNMLTIQPQLAPGIPSNSPFWHPVAGNFMSMPSIPPNPSFQPPFNSTSMKPQSPSMSAHASSLSTSMSTHASSLSRGSSGIFQMTDGALYENEMFP